MAPLPRPSFRRRLRSLSAEGFRGFVTALWEARGYHVTEEGSRLAVRREDNVRHIAIVHQPYALGRVPLSRSIESSPDGTTAASEIDIVVTNGPSERLATPTDGAADPTVLDADDLYEVLLYSIPRTDSQTLSATYLDVDDPFGYSAESSRRPALTSALVWGLVVTVLVGTAGGFVFNGGIGTTGVAGLSTETPLDPSVPSPTPEPTTPTATTTAERNALAPGVDMAGVFDAAQLAEAHQAAITGSSYTWVLTYTERYPDRDPVVHVETIRVASPVLYVSDINRTGDPLLPTPISDREAYANDRYRFIRVFTDSGIRYAQRPIDSFSRLEGRNANRAASYVQQYLTGEETTITGISQRNGTVYYTVRTVGDPRPQITNATTTATIDSNGLVYRLQRTHQLANRSDVTVTITLTYTNIGNTTVDRPSWFQTARNRTE